jgi:hypothetical protein
MDEGLGQLCPCGGEVGKRQPRAQAIFRGARYRHDTGRHGALMH